MESHGRNPDTMIYHRVHSAFEKVSSLHDPITKHFILADSEEQECARTVVFAVFTSCYEFFAACHWTQVTQVWTFLTCVEAKRGGLCITTTSDSATTRCPFIMEISLPVMVAIATPRFKLIVPMTDVAQGWVANAPAPGHVKLLALLCPPSIPDAVDNARHDDTPTFEQTGDPLSLIGRDSGRRSQGIVQCRGCQSRQEDGQSAVVLFAHVSGHPR